MYYEDSYNFSLLRELKEGKSVNLACKVINCFLISYMIIVDFDYTSVEPFFSLWIQYCDGVN